MHWSGKGGDDTLHFLTATLNDYKAVVVMMMMKSGVLLSYVFFLASPTFVQ